MNVNGQPTRTIVAARDAVEIVDQTALPHAFVTRQLRTAAEVANAIAHDAGAGGAPDRRGGGLRDLAGDARGRVRRRAGGGAHGVAGDAAHGGQPALGARHDAATAWRRWPPDARAAAARAAADAIADEDVAINRAIGEHARRLIEDVRAKGTETVQMLTHCNAGWLATVDWGTALAGVYAAHDAGVPVHVWVDETRPRNQGAALTAWELGAHGVPHTVIVDNAGGHLMQRGQVDIVLRRHGPDDGAPATWSTRSART